MGFGAIREKLSPELIQGMKSRLDIDNMKLSFFTLCVVLWSSLCNAQEYVPFPTEDATWIQLYQYFLDVSPSGYEYSVGDTTTIDGNIYSEVYFDNTENPWSPSLVGGLREDSTRKIFFYPIETSFSYLVEFPSDTAEYLLYDFGNVEPGTQIQYDPQFGPVEIIEVDSILIDDNYRRVYETTGGGTDWNIVVEGIGGMYGLFSNWIWIFEWNNALICYHDNETDFINEFFWFESCSDNIPESLNALKLYPNPAVDAFYIDGLQGLLNFKIISMQGTICHQGSTSGRVDVVALTPGMYVFLTYNGDTPMAIRFLKE